MKRLAYALVLVLLAGGTWRAIDNFRMKHPVSGAEIAVPGHNGPNALLVSGWKTTPAGRQLPSGDMILSGQISPDRTLFAFTNTGYTHHGLHVVDLATEKEIATFPLEQSWSGLAFSPDGRRIYISSGAGYPGNDIQFFDRWDSEGWRDSRSGYTLVGAVKANTAVSSITVSADGTLLYALNNSDDHLYLLETYRGRAVARLNVGDIRWRPGCRRTARRSTSRTSAERTSRWWTSASANVPAWPRRSPPIRIPTIWRSPPTGACSSRAATPTA